MLERMFTVKYTGFKDSFCYLSSNVRDLKAGSCIKIVYGNDRISYFSVSTSINSLDDQTIGINSLYAKTLGIKEGELVTLSEIAPLPSVKSVTISPVNRDDYEVLEILANNVQTTLLDQIRVLNIKQNFIIWIGGNINITAFIDELTPVYPGCIDNLTEVIIKYPEEITIPETSMISDKDGAQPSTEKPVPTKFDEFLNSCDWKLDDGYEENSRRFQRYLTWRHNLIYRLIRMKDLTISKEINKFSIPFNAFVSKASLPPQLVDMNTSSIPLICEISLLTILTTDHFAKKPIFIRVLAFEDLLPNLEPQFEQNIFVSDVVMKYFECDMGARIFLKPTYNFKRVTEIEISVKKNFLVNVIENFKLHLAGISKTHTYVLNEDIPLEIGDNLICTLKFLPPEARFCIVDEDFVGNCKFSVNNESVNVSNNLGSREKLPKYATDVSNYRKIIEGAILDLIQTNTDKDWKLENILVTGKPGTGKSTLLKIIGDKIESYPNFIYIYFLSCKGIKGKTVESLHKVFSTAFSKLALYQPAVLMLDDLHVLCENVNEGDALAQNAIYFNRVSEMLHNFLKFVSNSNMIGILATTESTLKLNKNIYTSRGSHLFKNLYCIKEFTKADRSTMLSHLLSSYILEDVDLDKWAVKTEGFVVQDLCDFVNKSVFESYKNDSEDSKDSKGVARVSEKCCEKALENTCVLSLQDVQLHSPGNKDFSDIGGLRDIKKILVESLLWPAQYPNIFANAPLRLQSGLLLYGPPGTGKTILAGAAAKQCGLRLISIKGPELLSKYIGASEQAVRDVFQKAQGARPCILFFDEFDSLAPRRGHDNTGVTDRVVNQLLTQLDGVESLSGVCVLAATSRPDLLDPALLRPGRLDRQLLCPLPDVKTRLEILQILAGSLDLSSDINLESIASNTEGFSGADLQSVLYTAQLSTLDDLLEITKDTAETTRQKITQKQLEDALNKTRPSLTKAERMKYERIYKKFQGGNVEDFKTGSKVTLA